MNENIMNLLKKETESLHRQAENNAFSRALRQNTLHEQDYMTYLQQWYGFLDPLEKRFIHRAEWKDVRFDYAECLKTPLIITDLTAMGMSREAIGDLPVCRRLPDTPEFSHVLGVMYVLEGSTLGGHWLLGKLTSILSISPDHNGHFLNCYGNAVRARWQAFTDLVQRYTVNRRMEEHAVYAAKETFSLFHQWIA